MEEIDAWWEVGDGDGKGFAVGCASLEDDAVGGGQEPGGGQGFGQVQACGVVRWEEPGCEPVRECCCWGWGLLVRGAEQQVGLDFLVCSDDGSDEDCAVDLAG